MSTKRQRRVAEQIHKELSNLLLFEVKDPRVRMITITGTKVTPDLQKAYIFLSVYDEDEADALQGMESALPFLRRSLGQRLKLRNVPELVLHIDRSIAYGQKIENILSSLEIPPETTDDDPII